MCAAWRRSAHEEARRVYHCGADHRGTATEVTINYVITDVEKKRKFVRGYQRYPRGCGH